MSRTILENGNFIWRYRAGQKEPHALISLVHNIGEYRVLELDKDCEMHEYTADEYFLDMKKSIADAYSDVLKIKGEDIQKLRNLYVSLEDKIKSELDLFNQRFEGSDMYVGFEELENDICFMEENCPNVWFYKMVKNMVRYIDENPKEEYYFLGEV